MIDTTQHLSHIDTIKQVIKMTPVITNNNIELLEKVNAFYDSAWNKVIWVIGILIAIVGVAIPLTIQFWQNRKLASDRAELKREIENAINNATIAFTKYVDEQVKIKFDKLSKEVEAHNDLMHARTMVLQGNAFLKENIPYAIGAYIAAIENYYLAEDSQQVIYILEWVLKFSDEMKECSKIAIDEAMTYNKININELLNKLNESDKTGEIKDLTRKLKDVLTTLR